MGFLSGYLHTGYLFGGPHMLLHVSSILSFLLLRRITLNGIYQNLFVHLPGLFPDCG